MLSGKLSSVLTIYVLAVVCSIARAEVGATHHNCAQKIIIVDAGSSSSKLHTYQYTLHPTTRLPIVDNETSSKKSGGIQRVDVDNNDLDQYLELLFGTVKNQTPDYIYFYSTAGMRQITPSRRGLLNQSIEEWLKKAFPSSVIDVQTITGQKEGLYAWLALNYLNGVFAFQAPSQGVLELGGASTQIAYEGDGPGGFKVEINNKTRKVNTESFLGLGLDQAISQYLNQAACFPKGYILPNGRKGTGDFDVCTNKVEPLVSKVHQYFRHF